MRLLMLGWEFPPYISGGLGTACHGLVCAMERLRLEMLFMLPMAIENPGRDGTGPAPTPMEKSLIPKTQPAGRVQFKGIPARFSSPYPTSILPQADHSVQPIAGPSYSGTAPFQRGPTLRLMGTGAVGGYDGDLAARIWDYADRYASLTQQESFDIIHGHDWLAANAMIWIKQGRGHPCLLTIHSTEYARCGNMFAKGRSERVRNQERAGTYWADRVIAVSGATQKEIQWMYDVPAWKTSVIYNGVHPHHFDQTTDPGEDKRSHQIAPLDPTILFCGRLAWQKGPDLLVEALPQILRHPPATKVVFAGDGEMRGTLESRVRQLGVAHAVRFLGYCNGDGLVRLFKLADAVCVPSRNEPFGIVVLEAWSAHKPVIVTQNGGPNEYVGHEFNGLKIHPTPDSIGWGVGRMFSDFDRARWMGQNGRKTVEERFSWDTVANQTLAIYQELRPSPALPPSPMAWTLQTAPDGPSGEASRITLWDEDLVETGAGGKRDGESIYIQARLRFKATDPASGVPDALAAFRSDLAHSGLRPRRHDHSLSIKGDMETVLAALHRCRTRLQQADIWNTRPLSEGQERAAFFETVQVDPVVVAER